MNEEISLEQHERTALFDNEKLGNVSYENYVNYKNIHVSLHE